MRSKRREHYLKLEWLCANYPIVNRVQAALHRLDEMSEPEIDMLILDYERFIRSLGNRHSAMSDKLVESFDHHLKDAVSTLRLARVQKASMRHMEKPLLVGGR